MIFEEICKINQTKKLSNFHGKVKFDDVYFSYPTRPNVTILHGLTFEAEIGQIVALVGPSGCGMSKQLNFIFIFISQR